VLTYLLACAAAKTRAAHKYQIGDVIEKVCRDAYLLSDEFWGLVPVGFMVLPAACRARALAGGVLPVV